jgi:hypothetical protein
MKFLATLEAAPLSTTESRTLPLLTSFSCNTVDEVTTEYIDHIQLARIVLKKKDSKEMIQCQMLCSTAPSGNACLRLERLEVPAPRIWSEVSSTNSQTNRSNLP